MKNVATTKKPAWALDFAELADFITEPERGEMTVAFMAAAEELGTTEGADGHVIFTSTANDLFDIARERRAATARGELSEDELCAAMLWVSDAEREEIRRLAFDARARGSDNMADHPDLANRYLAILRAGLGRRVIACAVTAGKAS